VRDPEEDIVTDGYSFTYDEFTDWVRWVDNGSQVSRVTVTDLDNQTWRKAKIVHFENQAEMFLDDTSLFAATDASPITPAGNVFSFSGRTGGASNYHKIRHIRVGKNISPQPSVQFSQEIGNKSYEIYINNQRASDIQVLNQNTLTAKVPANPAGTYDVEIRTGLGDSAVLPNSFSYSEYPVIQSISPNFGSTDGGENVQIFGEGFLTQNSWAEINISNPASAIAGYQGLIQFDTATLISSGRMRNDCGDIRLYLTDQVTQIPYWIEQGCDTANTEIWFYVPNLPAGNSSIYLGYGNLELTSSSSQFATFPVFSKDEHVLWLDAQYGTNTTTNGDFVNQWQGRDKYGNFAESVPVYDDPVYATSAINGRPAISFPGDDNLQVTGGVANIRDGNPSTLFIVQQYASQKNVERMFGTYPWQRVGVGLFDGAPGEQSLTLANGSNTKSTGINTLPLNQPNILAVGGDLTVTKAWINGVNYIDDTTDRAFGHGFNRTFYIGAPDHNQTRKNDNVDYEGLISEIMLFDTLLTDSEREQVERYLGYKYGSMNLPLVTVQTAVDTQASFRFEGASAMLQSINFDQAEVITPAGAAGFADVEVVNPNSSNFVFTDGYEYISEYNIYLELGQISGLATTSYNPVIIHSNTTQILSPFEMKKADNLTNLDPGTVCTNILSLNGGVNVEYVGVLDANAQCITDIASTDINQTGVLEVRTAVTINGVGFLTEWNRVPVIAAINTAGLQAYYDFDHAFTYDGVGQVGYDLSGNMQDAIFGSGSSPDFQDPTFVSTPQSAVRFDGDDRLESSLLSNHSNNSTFEVWFARSDNSVLAVNQALVSARSADDVRLAITVQNRTVHTESYSVDTATNQVLDSQFIPNTQWQMATVTYDHLTQTHSLYLNAVLIAQDTVTAQPGSTDPILIGSRLADGLHEFVGDIAVVRVYSDALSGSAIQHHFDQEKTRFGFAAASPGVQSLTAMSLGSTSVATTTTIAQSTFDSIIFTDRRAAFAPYAATVSMTDFSLDSNPAVTISANNVWFDSQTQHVITGRGHFNTSAAPAFFPAAGIPMTLYSNSATDGGGEFVYQPEMQVTVPPYSAAGNYSAVLTISVS